MNSLLMSLDLLTLFKAECREQGNVKETDVTKPFIIYLYTENNALSI